MIENQGLGKQMKKLIIILIIVGLAGISCSQKPVLKEENKLNMPKMAWKDGEFKIKSDKTKYNIGEEIWIEGTIYNNSEKQFEMLYYEKYFYLAEASINFRIGEFGKDKYKLWPKLFPNMSGPDVEKIYIVKPLMPIEYFRFKLSDFIYFVKVLDGSSEKHPISEILKKGKYEIDISFVGFLHIPVYNIESNTIEIVIKEKAGINEIKFDDDREKLFQHYYGIWAEIIKLCDEVLEIDPNNITALQRKGSAYYRLGNKVEALKAWEKALLLMPDDGVLKTFIPKVKKEIESEEKQEKK